MTITETPTDTAPRVGCPTWCNDHAFDTDGTGWHCSQVSVDHGVEMFISTGTPSGKPEVFLAGIGDNEGMPLEQAVRMVRSILELIELVVEDQA